MTHYFDEISSFYRAYREAKHFVTMDDIMSLIGDLRDTATVCVRGDDTVVVLDHSDRYPAQKKYHKQHYTKLSASLPRETVHKFSEACRAFGVSQSSVLTPVIFDIVEKAKKIMPT
jgi:hypothetical protein